MSNPTAIEQLVQTPEGPTLEFKRDMTSPEGILRTVCAFANSTGGTLVIGVEDRSRRVLGLANPLAEEERLVNLIADSIRPQIVPHIEVATHRQRDLLVVQVFPGSVRPYWLKAASQQGGTFIRVGSSNRTASPETIAELKRWTANITHDELPVPDLDAQAIDFPAAMAMFADVRPLRRQDLRTLRILTREGNRDVPTIGGVLLFGKDRLQRFPDARISVAAFAGVDRTEILDMAELDSWLPQAIDQAMAFIRRNSPRRVTIKSTRRREALAWPQVAVREALVNAVVHADYSQRGSPIRVAVFADRLEIENPGLLPPGVAMDDLHRGLSRLRNRVIGRVFRELGLIEQWGSGVQRMAAACSMAGLPEPQFAEIGERFRVTLRAAAGSPRKRPTTSAGEPLLRLFADGGSATTATVAKALRISTRAARTRLKRLVEAGTLVEIGSGLNDPRRSYRLADPAP